jgi:hypothetical protein
MSTSAQMSACWQRERASTSLPQHKSLLFNHFTAAVMDDELPIYRGRAFSRKAPRDRAPVVENALRARDTILCGLNLIRAKTNRAKQFGVAVASGAWCLSR